IENLEQLRHFRNPRVVYECANAEPKRTPLEEEWLARAEAVVVNSRNVADAIADWRPDALLVTGIDERAASTLLDGIENDSRQKAPARQKALLAWRERQVNRLETYIRDRDRPAVDVLHGAVDEQKRIISERDKGIAFLRQELAGRDRIISERETALQFLQNEIKNLNGILAARRQADNLVRQEIETREQSIAALLEAQKD